KTLQFVAHHVAQVGYRPIGSYPTICFAVPFYVHPGTQKCLQQAGCQQPSRTLEISSQESRCFSRGLLLTRHPWFRYQVSAEQRQVEVRQFCHLKVPHLESQHPLRLLHQGLRLYVALYRRILEPSVDPLAYVMDHPPKSRQRCLKSKDQHL